ncbi:MAG TPA: SPFH domain-containing protein [Candidatus Polarisedimenticolia bacterium]|jgi:regulator of protease activity HflC (stomatin/prohibitin superfamily)|nr:SPFH domain-containing protein [Candidatus Polarisedimenticolia bacterium]
MNELPFGTLGFFALSIVLFIALIMVARSARIVSQYEKGLVMRLGKYRTTVDSGLTFLVPMIESLIKVDMRERVINVEPQKVITKDNVGVTVDAVIYYRISDPVKATFEVQNFAYAATTLAQTNLRNLIGDKSLDETLTARDTINTNLRNVLDEATNTWGVKLTRVEVQKIDPPADITEAMSRQMKAERDKRAQILEAEGVKQSQILQAEGSKQSSILKADGEAQARILQANAEAKAIEVTSVAAETFFKDRAEARQRLDVLRAVLAQQTKFVVPSGSNLLNILGLDDRGAGLFPQAPQAPHGSPAPAPPRKFPG